jgi:hypothetical protein
MENKKTIGDLNNHAWYRLLKVFFLGSLLIILAILNIINFSGGIQRVDLNKTIVQCNLGAKNSFTAQSIGLIMLNSDDFTDGQFNYKSFFEGYNDYGIGIILEKCYPKRPAQDFWDDQKYAELGGIYGFTGTDADNLVNSGFNEYQRQTNGVVGQGKIVYLDFSYKMFDISPVFTSNPFLKSFIFGNIIILLIFEIIRRIFYYIALGNFQPENREKNKNDKKKNTMETQQKNNLKITLENSFLEYLIALFGVIPLGFLLSFFFSFTLFRIGIDIPDNSGVEELGILCSFIILIRLATKVVKEKLKKKEEKRIVREKAKTESANADVR